MFERRHCVDELFDVENFGLTNKKGDACEAVNATVAYCTNLESLIQNVTEKRSVSNYHLKFGIDGGGKFLKVTLSIQATDNLLNENKGRQKYQDGISAKNFKDTGVNKLLILALAHNTQENYENVRQLWQTLKIDNFSGTIATDLKLANILVGIISHSSIYPCTWCYASKDNLNVCGEYRTVQNTTDNYDKWCKSGACKAKAKEYKNCIHPPIFSLEKDRSFLHIIPPPELHLMLGMVNTLYKHLLENCEEDAIMWAKECHVTRDVRHNGSSFNGNACKILLDKVDILVSWGRNLFRMGYVEAFRNFRAVVQACFSYNLDEEYKEKIEKFRESYLSLKIPVTPKAHAVFFMFVIFVMKFKRGLDFTASRLQNLYTLIFYKPGKNITFT